MASESNLPIAKTFLVGLSGPSSSGKTTLARFLRSIFNIPALPATKNRSIKLFILHEDDFYKTDKDIPLIHILTPSPSSQPARTIQDWDCVESLDLALFESTLSSIKLHGRLPDDAFSKEDQNSAGVTSVPQSLIDTHHRKLRLWLESLPVAADGDDSAGALPEGSEVRICILDGFLLYPDKSLTTNAAMQHLHSLSQLLDLKLFVPCSRKQMIERRTKRTGYVTLEGFWADPPGYVEDVVWPNFARDHAWLCKEDGGVEGKLAVDGVRAGEEGIVVAPGEGEGGLEELVVWATGVVGGCLGYVETNR